MGALEQRRRWPDRTLVVTLALVAVPFAGAIASLPGRHWYPSGDQALEVLRIRDVGGSHTPLLGAWSRWGWAHPGPALFWFLAPFYRALGTNGVLTGIALVNLAAVVGLVLVARRKGGAVGAALGGITVAILVNALGLARLIDPWNPWAAFLPFVLYLVLVWSVVCGDVQLLWVAVAVGSFVVQCHAGYLPLVGGLLLLATGTALGSIVNRRGRSSADGDDHDRKPPPRWRSFVSAGIVGVVLWTPAIAQQISGDPGNGSELISYLRDPPEPSAGWDKALGTMGRQLRPLGPWVTNREADGSGLERTASPLWAFATIATVAAAGAWARRRGATDAARLAVVALVAIALAFVATARVTGLFVPYVMRWWWGVAALSYLSIAWSFVVGVGLPRRRAPVIGVAVAGMAALAATVVIELPAALPGDSVGTAVGAVGAPTAAALDDGNRYLVRGVDRKTLDAASHGLFVELSDRGVAVFSEPGPNATLTYGSWRLATENDVDAVITMVAVPELDGGWEPPAGSRVVAAWDPLTVAERARARALSARIRAAMGEQAPPRLFLDGPDARRRALELGAEPEDVDELRRLQAPGDGFVVYLTAGGP